MRPILQICACLLLLPTCLAWGQEPLVISTINAQIPRVRVVFVVLDEIYRRLDVPWEVRPMPAARAIAEANAGHIDGELGRSPAIEGDAPNLIRVPVPVSQVEISAFVKNQPIQITGWESLRPYRIGLLRGLSLYKQETEGMQRQIVNSLEALFQLLYLERVDVVPFLKLDGLIAVRRANLHADLRALSPPLTTHPVYHYLRKSHGDLIARMTNLMILMQESGELPQLIHQAEMDFMLAPREGEFEPVTWSHRNGRGD